MRRHVTKYLNDTQAADWGYRNLIRPCRQTIVRDEELRITDRRAGRRRPSEGPRAAIRHPLRVPRSEESADITPEDLAKAKSGEDMLLAIHKTLEQIRDQNARDAKPAKPTLGNPDRDL